MKNIIWQKPDLTFSITTIRAVEQDSTTHATELLASGAIPADWVIYAVDVQPPSKALSEVKAEKMAELKAARIRTIDTLPPVIVAGKAYPATPEYREVVTGIARRQAAGRPIPATLRGVDGAPATLNAALITQIDDAITSAVQAVWDRYWTRFDAVQAATTTAEAESIVW